MTRGTRRAAPGASRGGGGAAGASRAPSLCGRRTTGLGGDGAGGVVGGMDRDGRDLVGRCRVGRRIVVVQQRVGPGGPTAQVERDASADDEDDQASAIQEKSFRYRSAAWPA